MTTSMDLNNALNNLPAVALGGLIGYLSSLGISNRNAQDTALAKLRSTFSPTIAKIRLFENNIIGHNDYGEVFTFIKTELLKHAAAIEEFRPFYSKNDDKYEKVWEDYQNEVMKFLISKGGVAAEGIKAIHTVPQEKQNNPIKYFLSEIRKKIENILTTASYKSFLK
jgi:hypothetical protein